jgi:pantetheine-phosphate adenylyltransferase
MTPGTKGRTGIYPGTFDPSTFGHVDLIERAMHLFDRLIIAVAVNPHKSPLFTPEERSEMIRESLEKMRNDAAVERVEVKVFSGLLAHLAVQEGATAILRGLRAVSDFEYEFQLALTNRSIAPAVETLFLMPNAKYTYLSSTIIKDVARHGGDVSKFVPEGVLRRLIERFGGPRF